MGLGSDYDGAVVPSDLTTCGGLPKLRQAMAGHGYGEPLITKLCHENWLRVLEKNMGGLTPENCAELTTTDQPERVKT